jgi:hypothetical protein
MNKLLTMIPEISLLDDWIQAMILLPKDLEVKLLIHPLHIDAIDRASHVHKVRLKVRVAHHTHAIRNGRYLVIARCCRYTSGIGHSVEMHIHARHVGEDARGSVALRSAHAGLEV